MFTSFIVVATMAVAMPAMTLVVVLIMTVVMTVVPVMTVVTVMQQRPQSNKSNRRAHNAVVVMGLCRSTGQRQCERAARRDQAKFVSCQVNHYYLPLYLVTPPI